MNIANNMVLSALYMIISGIKIISDYHIAFGYRPIDQPELIMDEAFDKEDDNKILCYNLFITHSNPLFTEFYLKETTDFLSTEVMLEDV